MMNEYRMIENSYIENFSKCQEYEDYILFCDEKLPDMYAFNCILIKEKQEEDEITGIINKILKQINREKGNFIKLFLHPKIKITESLASSLCQLGFQVQTNLYMQIDPSKVDNFQINKQAVVKRASTDVEFEAGREHDIKTSISSGQPEEFAIRKTLRKKDVFRDDSKRLYSYLCYYENQVVGECELHLIGEYAKIEDFDVLEEQRGKRFGTTILKKIIVDAAEQGAKYIYLITDKEDTPKEMYRKLGFVIIGEELELFKFYK